MMWFWLSLGAMVCWSGSDLFSKIGCAGQDKYSHLKMVSAVGCVMGLHALYEILFSQVRPNAGDFLRYLPVSALYIFSMSLGYVGLRYIELSVSSPICNASGALVAVLCLITGEVLASVQYIGIAAVCLGVLALGFVEMREDEQLKQQRREKANYKYTKSLLAILLPLLYCLLDALGTFADSIVLENMQEENANVAYELTFFLCGIACFVYTKAIKKQHFLCKQEVPKLTGAVFETAGQFCYIFALSDSAHVAMAAPIISSYCILSILWSRLLLKERLSIRHYLSIAVAVIGIVILGVYDV